MLLPTSSEIPHENPAALLALFEVVSISLKDLVFQFRNCTPIVDHNFLDLQGEELLETYIF